MKFISRWKGSYPSHYKEGEKRRTLAEENEIDKPSVRRAYISEKEKKKKKKEEKRRFATVCELIGQGRLESTGGEGGKKKKGYSGTIFREGDWIITVSEGTYIH